VPTLPSSIHGPNHDAAFVLSYENVPQDGEENDEILDETLWRSSSLEQLFSQVGQFFPQMGQFLP
jgi:hypothetical protein